MKLFRLTLLLGAVLLHGTPVTTLPAPLPAQIGTAQIIGSCPTNCKLLQSISVSTAEDGNGIRVGVDWTTSSLPAGIEMTGFNVSVKLVLKDNKTIDSSEQNHGANARSALVIVQGPATNRNINLSDVKSGTVTVKANAMTTSNPTINVTSKEIAGNDGAEVNMLVKWAALPAGSPCLADRTALVSASAENAGGIRFDGSVSARLSANSATVRLRGAGLRRKEMKNLQARLNVSPVFLTCGISKSIQSFGNGTGSNP